MLKQKIADNYMYAGMLLLLLAFAQFIFGDPISIGEPFSTHTSLPHYPFSMMVIGAGLLVIAYAGMSLSNNRRTILLRKILGWIIIVGGIIYMFLMGFQNHY